MARRPRPAHAPRRMVGAAPRCSPRGSAKQCISVVRPETDLTNRSAALQGQVRRRKAGWHVQAHPRRSWLSRPGPLAPNSDAFAPEFGLGPGFCLWYARCAGGTCWAQGGVAPPWLPGASSRASSHGTWLPLTSGSLEPRDRPSWHAVPYANWHAAVKVFGSPFTSGPL